MAADSHVFEDAFTYLDAVLATYLTNGSTAVAGAISHTAYTMLMIYVILWGWSMMRGIITEPITDMMHRVLKLTTITALSTNAALYTTDVVGFLYNWPTALAGVVSGGPATSSTALLDQTLGNGLDLFQQIWEQASLANLGAYPLALLVAVVGIIVTALTACIIISAKFGLTLALAIGPVFILLVMFDATRRMFESWLSVCITSGLVITLVSMAANLLFKYYAAVNAASISAVNGAGGVATMGTLIGPLVIGIMAAWFIRDIPSFAAGFGGGVSMASSAAAGWAYDRLKDAARPRDRQQRGNQGNNQGNGRLGRGQSNSLSGSSKGGAPSALYRKIVTRSNRRAAA